jgi:hypothetical protein
MGEYIIMITIANRRRNIMKTGLDRGTRVLIELPIVQLPEIRNFKMNRTQAG